MCIAGTASAYQLYVKCPSEKPSTDTVSDIQAGIPLKCAIDSNFPAGTTFDLALYQTQYTATLISKQTVTIQENHNTIYKLFDTQGLPGGSYKIEIQFIGSDDGRTSSDSVTWQMINLIDRSDEIEITSPITQELKNALRIEGSIKDLGSGGVQIEVRGPDGRIFGPQYIATTNNIQNSAGKFTKKVTVSSAGTYDVDFSDADGYIGKVTFTVVAPKISATTVIPTTTAMVVKTSNVPTTEPTPWPVATQSPLSPLTVLCSAGLAGLFIVLMQRR
jgi:hypothetical protein